MERNISLSMAMMIILLLLSASAAKRYEEPICTSRFDFEEKMLEKMVRMEHAMEMLKEDLNKQQLEFTKERQTYADKLGALQDLIDNEQNKAQEERKKSLDDMRVLRDRISKEEMSMRERLEVSLQSFNVSIRESQDKFDSKDKVVAFSVRNGRSSLVDGIPIFTVIDINEGGAYDIHTGKFTCPLAGIYSFRLGIRSRTSSSTCCFISLNGNISSTMAISTGANNMASTTTTLKLEVNGIVKVGSCGNWNTADLSGVSFSGHLVFET